MKIVAIVAAACVAALAAAAGEATLDASVKKHGAASSWTTAVVAEVFGELGFSQQTTTSLVDHNVDGLVLFDLDDKALEFLRVSPVDAARFRAVISKLHKTVSEQDLHHSDLWDIRALHRNKFHTLVGAAQTSPFVTLAYLRLFQPGLDDVIFGAEREDAEPAFSWVWWLVCPARIVWRYLAPFWDTNWVLVLGIFMPVMVHQVTTYALLLSGQWRKLLVDTLSVSIGVAVGAVIHYNVIFPLTPRFLTNWLFYASIVLNIATGIFSIIGAIQTACATRRVAAGGSAAAHRNKLN